MTIEDRLSGIHYHNNQPTPHSMIYDNRNICYKDPLDRDIRHPRRYTEFIGQVRGKRKKDYGEMQDHFDPKKMQSILNYLRKQASSLRKDIPRWLSKTE